MLVGNYAEDLLERLQRHPEILRRHAFEAVLDEGGMQTVEDIVHEVAHLDAAESGVDAGRPDAVRDEPAQGAGEIGLDLGRRELTGLERGIGVLRIALAKHKVGQGAGGEGLGRQAGDPIGFEPPRGRRVEIGCDIALPHRGRWRVGETSAELRPDGRRIAVLRLTVMGDPREDGRDPGHREDTGETAAQAGDGLEDEGRRVERGGEGRQRPLLMGEGVAFDVHLDGDEGVCRGLRQAGGLVRAKESHLGTCSRGRGRERGRHTEPLEGAQGHLLAHPELMGLSPQDLDRALEHGALRSGAHTTVTGAEGRCRGLSGDGEHLLRRAHGSSA